MTETAQIQTPATASESALRVRFDAFRSRGLKLNLTRGKPSSKQLDLSQRLLNLPGADDWKANDNTDCRNYGVLTGIPEVRRLFAEILGAPADQVIVAGNSSLALMHDTVAWSLLKGTSDSTEPWAKQQDIAFVCPVPGYDRHFRICQEFGIRMIPVAMRDTGPDIDEVERLVAADPSIKAMWCMPKYSNPTGATYSDDVVKRLASMPAAARDFRLLWDNAYVVHHLTPEKIEIANILELCSAAGNPNRAMVYASTSKITLAGAGLALFAASLDNVRWMVARFTPRTIGPDKLNQLRHARFLPDLEAISSLMDRHRELISPKFEAVLDVFDRELAGIPEVSWTRPKGGYFIALTVPPGCAQLVVNLANEIGIELTPAGATYPFGVDPDDRMIRIAPTFPELPEVELAAEGVALCVQVAFEMQGQNRS